MKSDVGIEMLITKNVIEREYCNAVEACATILPIDNWSLEPSGIDLTSHKSKYGMATPEGKVLIAKAFLYTTAINKLRNTLRHELAHLAVGLHHHHNKYFKSLEYAFGATVPIDNEELNQIERNISFKWNLVAHLENGETLSLGGVHRKTKKYSEYKKTSTRSMSIEGVFVSRFEFIEL